MVYNECVTKEGGLFMKIEFGVASLYHMAGAPPSAMHRERFADYDSAVEFSRSIEECCPTIYCITEDGFCYHCERSAVKNEPWCIRSVKHLPDRCGYITTDILWDAFVKDPVRFVEYAAGILLDKDGE